MPEIIIMIGCPSAGKDTWVSQHVNNNPHKKYVLVSSDDELYEIGLKQNLVDDYNRVRYMDVISLFYSQAKKIAMYKLKKSLAQNRNIIINRTHTSQTERIEILNIVPKKYIKKAVVMDTPLKILFNRWRTDPKGIPNVALVDRFVNFQPVKPKEGFNTIHIIPPTHEALNGKILPSPDLNRFTPGLAAAKHSEWYSTDVFKNLRPANKIQPEILVMVGIPCSGKTTYAAWHVLSNPSKDYEIVSSDRFLYKIGLEKGLVMSGRVLSTDVFLQYYTLAKQKALNQLQKAIATQRNIIVDRSHVSADERKQILDLIPTNYSKKAVFMNTPLPVILQRWQKDGKGIRNFDMMAKIKALKTPSRSEGFDQIIYITPDMVPINDKIISKTDRDGFTPGLAARENPSWYTNLFDVEKIPYPSEY